MTTKIFVLHIAILQTRRNRDKFSNQRSFIRRNRSRVRNQPSDSITSKTNQFQERNKLLFRDARKVGDQSADGIILPNGKSFTELKLSVGVTEPTSANSEV